MKKMSIVGLTAIVAMSLGLQGCNDTQQAVAAGAIIGAAVGIAVSSDNDSHHDHGRRPPSCHGDYRQECSSYRDYYGNYVRQCRRVYDSCARYYETAMNWTLDPSQKPVSEADVKIAQTWSMGFEGAAKISGTVKRLNAGDTSAIKAWGLSSSDLMDWSKGRELSSTTIDKVAKSLNISWDQADTMVKAVSAKAREQIPAQEWTGY